MSQTTVKFCNLIRERSTEHESALTLLLNNKLYIPAFSILRQELDSMIRVVYLLHFKNIETRNLLIQQTLSNKKWRLPNSKKNITDRDMVELSNYLNGWTQSVYNFSCAFVHLSPLIDYKNSDLAEYLSCEEINNIKKYMHYYHGFPLEEDLMLASLLPYMNPVFDKVSGNLECYLTYLENEKIGEDK